MVHIDGEREDCITIGAIGYTSLKEPQQRLTWRKIDPPVIIAGFRPWTRVEAIMSDWVPEGFMLCSTRER